MPQCPSGRWNLLVLQSLRVCPHIRQSENPERVRLPLRCWGWSSKKIPALADLDFLWAIPKAMGLDTWPESGRLSPYCHDAIYRMLCTTQTCILDCLEFPTLFWAQKQVVTHTERMFICALSLYYLRIKYSPTQRRRQRWIAMISACSQLLRHSTLWCREFTRGADSEDRPRIFPTETSAGRVRNFSLTVRGRSPVRTPPVPFFLFSQFA